MAKDFSQVKEPQKIIDAIPSLKVIRYFGGGNDIPVLKSPLETKLTASFDGQNIIFQITLNNNQEYEWFLNTLTVKTFFITDEQGNELMSYPIPKANPGGRSDGRRLTDKMFILIEPNEQIEQKIHMSAKLFYENWKGKNVMVRYVNNGIPPSIDKIITEKYSTSYVMRTETNRVMINCYDHDDKKGYLCKIDVLDD